MKLNWVLTREILVVILALTAIEFFCFSTSIKHVGFYLDDWQMLKMLSNGPDGFWDLYLYYMSIDPRVLNRPVEALHYVAIYAISGVKPLGYHIINCIMEVGAAVLFYGCLRSVSNQRHLGFLAAALLLLYPSHNITHYWIVSSCVTLSLVLYFISLLLDIQAVQRKLPYLHSISAMVFAISLLNYEVFLPLAALNVLTVFSLKKKDQDLKNAFIYSLLPTLLLSLAIAVLFAYYKWVMPMLGEAWMHPVSLDPILMGTTLLEGIKINFPGVAFSYFGEHAGYKLKAGLSTLEYIYLVASALAFLGSYIFLQRIASREDNSSYDWQFINTTALIGAITVVVSYIIFGVNSEYMPVFNTFVNRVNTGASIGLAILVFAGALTISRFSEKKKVFGPVIPIFGALCLVFYTIANWGLAHPFVISWQLQSQVMKAVEKNKDLLAKADSVFLANAPRYASEAPVFDGVWDFQGMLRLLLEDKEAKGGVVCSRLQLSKDKIQDRSKGGFLCAEYTYNNLYVIISPTMEIVRVNSSEEFIELIEKRGMDFELVRDLPAIWRKQLASDKN